MGREQELTMLHQDLQRGDYVAIGGIGGVGKSELAAQYAKKHENDYGGITWFNSRENLAGEVLEFFSLQLGLEIPQELGGKQLNLNQQIAWCWSKYPDSPLPILIIFDDVTELAHLREAVPTDNRFRVLVTTRLQNLDPNFIQQLPLDILSPKKALELLQNLLGNKDKRVNNEGEAATAICEFLEYLPLGIILVAGYLLQDPGLTLTIILERLRQRKLAEAALQNRPTINKIQLGIKAAFALTWEELNPQAQQLGALLSLFSPQLIWWELVVLVVEFEAEDEEIRLTWTEEEINEAKKQLYQRNLLQQVEAEDEFYKIHALVRLFLQEQLTESEEMKPVLERTFITPMIKFAQALPQSPTSKDIEWFRYVVPHLEDLEQRLTEAIKEKTQAQINLPASILADEVPWVFVGVGKFYEGQGRYSEAEPLYIEALAMFEQVLGVEHPNTVTVRKNLLIFQQQRTSSTILISSLGQLARILLFPFYLLWLLVKRILILCLRLFRR